MRDNSCIRAGYGLRPEMCDCPAGCRTVGKYELFHRFLKPWLLYHAAIKNIWSIMCRLKCEGSCILKSVHCFMNIDQFFIILPAMYVYIKLFTNLLVASKFHFRLQLLYAYYALEKNETIALALKALANESNISSNTSNIGCWMKCWIRFPRIKNRCWMMLDGKKMLDDVG